MREVASVLFAVAVTAFFAASALFNWRALAAQIDTEGEEEDHP
jgi:hypothetical protein